MVGMNISLTITSENYEEVERLVNSELKKQRESNDYETSMVMVSEGFILAETCKVTYDGLVEVAFFIGDLHIGSALTTNNEQTLSCHINEEITFDFNYIPPVK